MRTHKNTHRKKNPGCRPQHLKVLDNVFENSPGDGVHSTNVSSLNQSINIAQLFLSQLGTHVIFITKATVLISMKLNPKSEC